MDSEVKRRVLIDVVDSSWQLDKLPDEDIAVPQMELPELETDNGNTNETLREQEQKWTDMGLSLLQDSHHTAPQT